MGTICRQGENLHIAPHGKQVARRRTCLTVRDYPPDGAAATPCEREEGWGQRAETSVKIEELARRQADAIERSGAEARLTVEVTESCNDDPNLHDQPKLTSATVSSRPLDVICAHSLARCLLRLPLAQCIGGFTVARRALHPSPSAKQPSRSRRAIT